MKLPLYDQAREGTKRLVGDNLNLGLYYQKFCDGWQWDRRGIPILNNKGEFLSRIAEKTSKFNTGESAILLRERIERKLRLVETLGGEIRIYELKERFVTGVGLHHPVE